MNARIRRPGLALGILLAACGPATAQSAGAPSPEGGALERAHIYEVAAEQLAAPDTQTAFIEVSGSAQVTVDADRASVSFAVETEAEVAARASGDNADQMDAVIRALRGTGLSDLTIETHGYNLQPLYSRRTDEGRPPRIYAYRAVNNVRVTTSEVDAVGTLLDAAVQAGANRVASLAFDARDTEAARLEVLRMAVEKAAQEARTIALALGVTLGPPLEVRGGAEAPPPIPMMRSVAFEAAVAAPTPVEPSQQTVSATVTVRYRIGSDGS